MSGSEELQSVTSHKEEEENVPPENRLKRKRHHRHTPEQIKVMEEIFRDCPHPDTKRRVEISQELGMDILQVKFWFQNKRTYMKTKHERHYNANLKSENEKLNAENKVLKETLNNSSCTFCGHMADLGGMSLDECHLRMENARLKDEINRISGVAANYVGKPMTNPMTNSVAAPYSGVQNAAPYAGVQNASNLGFFDEELNNILQ